jgi:hypothetical protein
MGLLSLLSNIEGVVQAPSTATNGSLVFFVRLGGKPIEFEKGKSGTAVASVEKLSGMFDALIAAVRNGELLDL